MGLMFLLEKQGRVGGGAGGSDESRRTTNQRDETLKALAVVAAVATR
jgi:hypothetical protein